MPNHFSTLLIILLAAIILSSLPLAMIFAANGDANGSPGGTDASNGDVNGSPSGSTPSGDDADGSPEGTTWILNPLKVNTIRELIDLVLNWLLMVAIPLSTLVIIYAALLFMISGGEKGRIEKARKTLTYAVIGITILLLAKGLSYTIANFLTP